MAVRMLYQVDLGGSPLPQVFNAFDLGEFTAPGSKRRTEAQAQQSIDRAQEAFEHARGMVEGTLARRDEIDQLIRSQAANWRLERMPPVDRNILRLAVYEMLCEIDVPKLVVMDEAIELAKKYGSEQSGRFINGMLDGLLKAHSFPGSLK